MFTCLFSYLVINSSMVRPSGRSKEKQGSQEAPVVQTLADDSERATTSSLPQMTTRNSNAPASLYEKFVLLVENSNRLKKCVKLDKQARRTDPNFLSVVSSDEAEDDGPDILSLAPPLPLPITHPLQTAHTHGPTATNPPIPTVVNWTDVMTTTQQSQTAPTAPIVSTPIISTPVDDFSTFPSIYNFDEIVSNTYHLNSVAIPNALLQMAFNKLFIPLSMLRVASVDHIRFNQNLKYHKIVFGNGTGKYSLDESIFPDKLALSELEFWQAYRNWLAIIDVVTDTKVLESWKSHHSKMITDTSFFLWFQSWQEHNRLLRLQFILSPFIVLPDSMEYCTQFKWCRNDQAHKATATLVANSWRNIPWSSMQNSSSGICYHPYDKSAHSFCPQLCVHCSISGHKASNCLDSGSNAVNH